jgi:hypothetical protein
VLELLVAPAHARVTAVSRARIERSEVSTAGGIMGSRLAVVPSVVEDELGDGASTSATSRLRTRDVVKLGAAVERPQRRSAGSAKDASSLVNNMMDNDSQAHEQTTKLRKELKLASRQSSGENCFSTEQDGEHATGAEIRRLLSLHSLHDHDGEAVEAFVWKARFERLFESDT